MASPLAEVPSAPASELELVTSMHGGPSKVYRQELYQP